METKHAMYLTSSSAEDLRRGRYVPWVIAAFFLSFITPLLFFVWIAFQNKPSLVTEHAYDKGLAYNQTLEAAAAQRALGWTAAADIKNGMLSFFLTDKKGVPITGATVKAWALHPSNTSLDHALELHEENHGVYKATERLPQGLWKIRITALYHGDEFQFSTPFEVK